MEYSLEWLERKDAPEALDFLNMVYSMAGSPHDFREMLPKMWEYDGAYVNKHLALKVGGKIRSLVGVYPLWTYAAGEKLLFSTMGNVATHPLDTGKGYMTVLLKEAMRKLAELDVDAARLGGKRHRYSLYGYEPAGVEYTFTLTAHNILRYYRGMFQSGITFGRIERADAEKLLFAKGIFEKGGMWVDRINETVFYDSLTAWRNVPWIAISDGQPVGYLTASPDGKTVEEAGADTAARTAEMLCAWLAFRNIGSLTVSVAPWEAALLRELQPLCENWNVSTPSLFYIRRWDRVAHALLKLKNLLTPLPDGEIDIGIEGYGTLHIAVEKGDITAVREEGKASFLLSPGEAARFLFGMLPPYAVKEIPAGIREIAAAYFPLPLGWNTLDRV